MKRKTYKRIMIWPDDAQKLINKMTNWQNSQWLRAGATRKIESITELLSACQSYRT